MSKRLKIFSGGGCCVVLVREIPVDVGPVDVGEVDRRVLVADIDAELGLVTSVWVRIGQVAIQSTPRRSGTGVLLIPVSGVDDAESRIREQAREENMERNDLK